MNPGYGTQAQQKPWHMESEIPRSFNTMPAVMNGGGAPYDPRPALQTLGRGAEFIDTANRIMAKTGQIQMTPEQFQQEYMVVPIPNTMIQQMIPSSRRQRKLDKERERQEEIDRAAKLRATLKHKYEKKLKKREKEARKRGKLLEFDDVGGEKLDHGIWLTDEATPKSKTGTYKQKEKAGQWERAIEEDNVEELNRLAEEFMANLYLYRPCSVSTRSQCDMQSVAQPETAKYRTLNADKYMDDKNDPMIQLDHGPCSWDNTIKLCMPKDLLEDQHAKFAKRAFDPQTHIDWYLTKLALDPITNGAELLAAGVLQECLLEDGKTLQDVLKDNDALKEHFLTWCSERDTSDSGKARCKTNSTTGGSTFSICDEVNSYYGVFGKYGNSCGFDGKTKNTVFNSLKAYILDTSMFGCTRECKIKIIRSLSGFVFIIPAIIGWAFKLWGTSALYGLVSEAVKHGIKGILKLLGTEDSYVKKILIFALCILEAVKQTASIVTIAGILNVFGMWAGGYAKAYLGGWVIAAGHGVLAALASVGAGSFAVVIVLALVILNFVKGFPVDERNTKITYLHSALAIIPWITQTAEIITPPIMAENMITGVLATRLPNIVINNMNSVAAGLIATTNLPEMAQNMILAMTIDRTKQLAPETQDILNSIRDNFPKNPNGDFKTEHIKHQLETLPPQYTIKTSICEGIMGKRTKHFGKELGDTFSSEIEKDAKQLLDKAKLKVKKQEEGGQV